MILFSEALSLSDVNKEVGGQPATVVVGRFQPPTLNHIKMIQEAYSKYHLPTFVGVVKSSNSNSPFPADLIKEILEKNLSSSYTIFDLTSGFIGDWIDFLRNEDYEPKYLVCGSDRSNDYQNQINRYKGLLNLNIKIDTTSIDRNEEISGTKARQYLKDNDKESFKKIVTPQTLTFWDELRKYI